MRLSIIAALALLTASAFAADTPPQTVPVQLSANDVQVIAAALNMAAGTCTQDSNGCVIGLNKGPILKKLQDAAAILQAEADKKAKK